ncbi:response regulator [Belnapia sp. T6]|uniref:Response regulator n=1 Tax=Belnapia mucosa TaxID=2804532 RepID=A0ABS1V3J1_9PROT|nr:response regulator [Belnapia mucosa]MBL6456250.1 response regulator [Belnapia mucosa]
MPDHSAGALPAGLRVLIVEDEFLIADYLAMLLEEAGHQVVGTAATGEEALALLGGGVAADIVSLDVKLPGGMDGIGVAAWLRDRAGPPFLFVTGSGDPASRARCEAAGPLAILQKPVDPVALERVLAGVRRG